MNVYEVEYRAVVTLAAQDMQKAASQGASVIKLNPHLFHLRAVHEKNFQPGSRIDSGKERKPAPEETLMIAELGCF